MSTYSDFAEKMIIALYQESERTEKSYYTFGELIDRYGLESKNAWIQRLADEWEHSFASDISRVLGGGARPWSVRLSGQGMRYVEEKYGDKDGVGTILEPVKDEPANLTDITGSRIFLSSDGTLPNDPREGDIVFHAPDISVDSSAWTGLPKRGVLGREAVERVARALEDTTNLIERSPASNSEKSQARSYVLAIKALAESPEPPADLIWQLVERANSIAGIASLFVALVALFAHG